jgi:phospholipid/cholesterol/gamma-HCH transport system substrate-binding protein
MKRFNLEIAVGLFLVIGFLCFAWLAIRLGEVGIFAEKTYPLVARFGSVSGLREGSIVEIAGVRVGTIKAIRLDPESYEAVVHMAIQEGLPIQEDSIASIRSTGIIGERYVSISPGGSPEILPPGGTIIETESAISLEEILGKYIFEGK